MRLWQVITQQGEFLARRVAPFWSKIQHTGKLKASSLRGFVSLFLIGASLSMAIAACAPNNSNSSTTASGGSNPGGNTGNTGNVKLTLVSYSVTQAAYAKIIPQFKAKWKQEKNQDITFKESYGGSGSQARAVVDGLEADVVHLSLALDIQKIEKAGLIQPGWETEAANGAVPTKSVAALVTRDGNPKGIQNWADLAKDGVKVITANPKTSGGARWNFLGIWGSVTRSGGDDAKAQAFTTKVFKNVPILPKDAREASDVFFKQGQGDVLIQYENEVVLAGQNGQKLPYVVPGVNISIDSPVAVVDKNATQHGTKEVAEAFVKFLYTPEAQREFAKVGFRPVDPTVGTEVAKQYTPIQTLFTAQDLGGWKDIQKKFFDDGAIFDKIQAGANT